MYHQTSRDPGILKFQKSLYLCQLDQGLPRSSDVKRFNPQFVGDCKRQVTMGSEDVIRMLKISHYLEAIMST